MDDAIQAYYHEDWASVRNSFEREISAFSIDDEAKATFGDALKAHEVGLFRCVARTLFPEIERVSRVEVHNGAMDKIAGQSKLKEAIGDMYPDVLATDAPSGMMLYDKLMDHLYANLTTPDIVDAVSADPVPNRHAAVHGYVSYNTMRHSLNALIIGEFLLRAISIIASAGHEDAPDGSSVTEASQTST